MVLLVGTFDGLFAVPEDDDITPERLLDATVHRLHSTTDGCIAATASGLYRTADGRSWDHVADLPGAAVSTAVSPDGECWYVGTDPAAVYVSTDDGASWHELDALQSVPDRERWRDRAPGDDASVRTMAVHPGAPDRLAVGIEPGGVYLSVDGGETWSARSAGVHDDVHHLLALGADEYVAACGNGIYRTADAGRTWLRQDTDFRDFWFNYFRESCHHDGTLYTAANGWGPAAPGGALFEAHDGGEVDRLPYPGENESFVVSWAVGDETVYAGTMDVRDGFGQYEPARILRREERGWFEAARVPAGARALATI